MTSGTRVNKSHGSRQDHKINAVVREQQPGPQKGHPLPKTSLHVKISSDFDEQPTWYEVKLVLGDVAAIGAVKLLEALVELVDLPRGNCKIRNVGTS